MFRIHGDTLQIFPASSEEIYALDFFGNDLEAIRILEPLTNRLLDETSEVDIFPAKHFMTSRSIQDEIVPRIQDELHQQILFFESQ